jgi:hypothetical protein
MEKQIERDIERPDCLDKKKKFFNCVLTNKNELTQKLSNDEWPNYVHLVNNINLKCWDDLGLNKCENFFSLYEIKY